MSKHYKAVVASYGFRGKFWDAGEVAPDVKDEENIPSHFAPVSEGTPDAVGPAKREPETLSELQEREYPKPKTRKKQ